MPSCACYQFIAFNFQILPFSLLCEKRSWPFKYLFSHDSGTEVLSVESAGETLQKSSAVSSVLAGNVLVPSAACLAPGS